MENKDQYEQFPESKYECLLFDIDDTLYAFSSGLSLQITKNIQEYMLKNLGIEEDKVPELCISLYKEYGTTMAGLRAIGYNFDYDEFHSFVHGRLPYNMLKPDPVLRSLLHNLPVRKLIFTNADKGHANRVLNRLGLEDCFEEILCFETLNPTNKGNDDINNRPNPDSRLPQTPVICKPLEPAYQQVFKIANINPKKTLFFDDNFRNIQTGKFMGLQTVLVGTSHRVKGADYALESIHNMKEALPELWQDVQGKSKNVVYPGKVAIETTVRA